MGNCFNRKLNELTVSNLLPNPQRQSLNSQNQDLLIKNEDFKILCQEFQNSDLQNIENQNQKEQEQEQENAQNKNKNEIPQPLSSPKEITRKQKQVDKKIFGSFAEQIDELIQEDILQNINIFKISFSYRVSPPCILAFDLKTKLFKEISVKQINSLPYFAKLVVLPDLKKLLLLGGSLQSQPNFCPTKNVYEYSLTSFTISKIKQMPSSHMGALVCQNQNEIFVIGGLTDNQSLSNQVERYDVTQNEWQVLPEILIPRIDGSAQILKLEEEEWLYVFGGMSQGVCTDQIERLNLTQTDN